jgi:glycogen(starch) synthase
MFGWEYPPRYTGGLGVATDGLVRGLLSLGVEVTLVLPRPPDGPAAAGLRIRGPDLRTRSIPSLLSPYLDAPAFRRRAGLHGGYGAELHDEVQRFAEEARRIAREESFDVIHAHDWMTYPAAGLAAEVSGRPWVAHVHSTEHDRTGGRGDPFVFETEREGVTRAARVVAVSRYTAGWVARIYGVGPDRLRVVYNAIDSEPGDDPSSPGREPMVLYAGRLTFQKGPDHLLAAAEIVLRHRPDVRFVLAGIGDMLPGLLDRVAELGLGTRILFTGFLEPEDLVSLYRRADVYVLPSVSEPFGLTVLEALRHGVPVIVSREAGVAEVVHHALKVDFWDSRELAAKILSLLSSSTLREEMVERGREEIARMSWTQSARQCLAVYREIAA